MKIIYFQSTEKDRWNNFVVENALDGGLLQSWEWGEFQKSLGKKIWRIGIKDEKDNLLLVCLAFLDILALKQKTIEVYRGPVAVNGQELKLESLLKILLKELKKIVQKEKAIVMRIDFGFIETKSLQSRKLGLRRASRDIQPRSTILINLKEDEEKILAQMKSKHRYNIRLAQRKKVKIFLCDLDKNICNENLSFRDGFEKFWELTKITSQRDRFAIHNKDYYFKLLNNSQNIIKLYLALYNHKVIAGAMVGSFGKMYTYLHGASDNKFRNVMAPYLLQWQIIADAKNSGKKYYDLGGVKSEGGSSSSQKNWDGITRFKKGFCPENKTLEFMGLYEFPIKKCKYGIYKIIRKIVKNLKINHF